MKLVDGMRVRLIRGDKSIKHNEEYSNHASWIAGMVRVGSIGTIRQRTKPFPHFCIDWDSRRLKPKEGYCFMITEDSDFLEVI